MIRASPPTCTSSLGALISIWNEARLSPLADAFADDFGDDFSFPFSFADIGGGATGVGVSAGGAAGSFVAGARSRRGARSTSSGGVSIFSGGAGFSSSTSAGRDTPILVSDVLVSDEPALALGTTGAAGASNPPSA